MSGFSAPKVQIDGLTLQSLLAFLADLNDTIALGCFGVNPK